MCSSADHQTAGGCRGTAAAGRNCHNKAVDGNAKKNCTGWLAGTAMALSLNPAQFNCTVRYHFLVKKETYAYLIS